MATDHFEPIPQEYIDNITNPFDTSKMKQISQKFKEGVENNLNMTLEELATWQYCGGNGNGHTPYFEMLFGERHMPEGKFCVCNTPIDIQCYITPDKTNPNAQLVVIGQCCITRFIPKHNRGKRCKFCNSPHRNNLVDMCCECIKAEKKAEILADKEKKRIQQKKDDILYRTGCKKCVDAVMKGYKRCYTCNQEKKEPTESLITNECIKCVEQKKKGYPRCFNCNEKKKKAFGCNVCFGTGESYWSDGIYGECMECQIIN